MNTNIEPGCLCMVTYPDNYGKQLIALKKVAEAGEQIQASRRLNVRSKQGPLWEVSKDIDWGDGDYVPYIPERYLRRID